MTYIEDLDESAPDGSVDKVYVLDDHIREIKLALKTQFPGLGSDPVNGTATTINDAITKMAFTPADDLAAIVGADDAGGIIFEDRRGAANGVASLSSTGKIHAAQMPLYSSFESGVRLLFMQETPPVGWTEDDSFEEHALRIRSSANFGAGSGGSINFGTIFHSTRSTSNGTSSFNSRGSDGSDDYYNTTNHTHTVNLAVKYAIAICAEKD